MKALLKILTIFKVAGRMFDPELVVYNAGTDILDGDPLGRLKVISVAMPLLFLLLCSLICSDSWMLFLFLLNEFYMLLV